MKVNIKRPNITQYYFHFEPDDEIYQRCMWARINLDHDTFTMTATSDCGDYSYRWQHTATETFTHLMAKINSEYLMRKISSECVFDFGSSRIEAVAQYESWNDDGFSPKVLKELKGMEECSEEMYLRTVASLTKWEMESIPVCKRFPRGVETFAEIFCDHLQPILKEAQQ